MIVRSLLYLIMTSVFFSSLQGSYFKNNNKKNKSSFGSSSRSSQNSFYTIEPQERMSIYSLKKLKKNNQIESEDKEERRKIAKKRKELIDEIIRKKYDTKQRTVKINNERDAKDRRFNTFLLEQYCRRRHDKNIF